MACCGKHHVKAWLAMMPACCLAAAAAALDAGYLPGFSAFLRSICELVLAGWHEAGTGTFHHLCHR
eukprot:scaffold170568_cov17-Tisochrysis_lutea.AAC.1